MCVLLSHKCVSWGDYKIQIHAFVLLFLTKECKHPSSIKIIMPNKVQDNENVIPG